MSWFSDFFMTRAIANMLGFKGLERDVFFALNYLTHQQKKRPSSYVSRKKIVCDDEEKAEQSEPDLIVQCTKETYVKSIKYVANYLSENDNRGKTARIEIYKTVKLEE